MLPHGVRIPLQLRNLIDVRALSLSPLSLSCTPKLPREILWKKADIVSPSQVTEILNQRAAAIVEVCTQDWTLFLSDENDQK